MEHKAEDHPHPGSVLLKELEEIGLSQGTLARYIGAKADDITTLCAGTAPMTPVLAWKISRALGGSPRKWLELQLNYDLVRVNASEYENIAELGGGADDD